MSRGKMTVNARSAFCAFRTGTFGGMLGDETIVIVRPRAHGAARPSDRLFDGGGQTQNCPAAQPGGVRPRATGERRRAHVPLRAAGHDPDRVRQRADQPVARASDDPDPRRGGDRRRRYFRVRRGGAGRETRTGGACRRPPLRPAPRGSDRRVPRALGGIRGGRNPRGPVRRRVGPDAADPVQLLHRRRRVEGISGRRPAGVRPEQQDGAGQRRTLDLRARPARRRDCQRLPGRRAKLRPARNRPRSRASARARVPRGGRAVRGLSRSHWRERSQTGHPPRVPRS